LGGLPKNSFSSLDIDETSLSKEEIASGLKGFYRWGYFGARQRRSKPVSL
jgi:hypothetical protein